MIINEVKKATTKYLEGKLKEICIINTTPDIFNVSVIYKDKFNFNYDYDFEINNNINKVRFIKHHIINHLYDVTLNRDRVFEEKITHILCE